MAAKKKSKQATRAKPRPKAKRDVPQFFRLNLEVGDLAKAADFYQTLLGLTGRMQAGSRLYFQCGAVTLQVVDVGPAPYPAAKALYFTVKDLDAVHERARELGCLAPESVHGSPGGEIVVRPWGERSFYANDPWRNPLCFVEAGTTYGG
ncbi:MAG: VOC family protein [Planctomycetes bacterium]|nr:VOC family protein [Planctomycetota bacterium]